MDKKISTSTIRRLPIYLRYLERMHTSGVFLVSSNEMGKFLGFNPAQVRKDLSYFGDFGRKGLGYEVPTLINSIRSILNIKETINVCLVGVGHLGSALYANNQEQRGYIKIVSLFDNDKRRVGKSMKGLTVQPLEKLKEEVENKNIQIGIICVPSNYAQIVTNQLIKSGVKSILNFAPIMIKTPDDVKVEYIDFGIQLHSLAYFLEK